MDKIQQDKKIFKSLAVVIIIGLVFGYLLTSFVGGTMLYKDWSFEIQNIFKGFYLTFTIVILVMYSFKAIVNNLS